MDRTKRARLVFWACEGVFFLVFLLWTIGSPQLKARGVGPPWLASSLWFFSLILLVPALVALQQVKHIKSQVSEVWVSIFLAFAVGVLLIGGDDRTKPPLDLFKEEHVKALTVAIVVFAVTMIARSSRLLEQSADIFERGEQKVDELSRNLTELKTNLAEQKTLYEQNRNLSEQSKAALAKNELVAEKLKVTTQDAIQTIAEARYGGLAAKALDLKQVETLRKKTGGELDTDIPDATEPGLGALAAWIRAGRDIAEDHARQAWWRVMNIYHQEEIYDISSREIATNVRSYAYTLLAVVSEFLRCTASDPNKRLAIANVSGFAPKDFYNFPNGPVGSRFYHEAEFFGIYRRLLAVIAADQRVVPIRVVLADPAKGIRSQTSDVPAADTKRQIGWKLDPIWKLVLDCARLHIVPWPVVGPTAQSNAKEDLDPVGRRTDWGVVFPEGRDPAKKLPYSTRRFLWAPTYADVRNMFRFTDPTITSTREKWIDCVLPFEQVNTGISPETLRDKAKPNTAIADPTRIENMRRERSAFCETYLGRNSSDPANLRKRLDDAWSKILQEFVHWIDLSEIDADRVEHVVQLKALQSIDSELRDRGITLPPACNDDAGRYLMAVNRAYHLSQLFLQNKLDPHETNYTDKLLYLAETCHEIDALGKYLQIESRPTQEPEYSSAGVELGAAENWLHRLLIWLEASGLESEIRNTGPLPLWRLMASGLCGIATGKGSNTVKNAGDTLKKVRGRLRICTVGCDSSSATTEMEKNFIFPEFLMVGATSADNLDADENIVDIKNVEWVGLVGASISDPYQTCRIQLLFGKEDARIQSHKQWLNEIWLKGDGDTKTFVDDLSAEVSSLQ